MPCKRHVVLDGVERGLVSTHCEEGGEEKIATIGANPVRKPIEMRERKKSGTFTTGVTKPNDNAFRLPRRSLLALTKSRVKKKSPVTLDRINDPTHMSSSLFRNSCARRIRYFSFSSVGFFRSKITPQCNMFIYSDFLSRGNPMATWKQRRRYVHEVVHIPHYLLSVKTRPYHLKQTVRTGKHLERKNPAHIRETMKTRYAPFSYERNKSPLSLS